MARNSMDSLLHNPMVSSAMEEQPSKSVTSENEIRKMMITPALKILNDPDNSVKSLHVLIRTMDRCCREEKKQSVFLGCEGDEDECKLAIVFTRWFLGSFSFIFTRMKLMEAFEPLLELQVRILHLFRHREPAQFASLTDEYVVLLKELVHISSQRFNGEISVSQPVISKAFLSSAPVKLAENCLLEMKGIVLGSIPECILLQINLTKLITQVADGILQYNRRSCPKLSCILLSQLDFGEADLIKPTLDCLKCIWVPENPSRVLDVFLGHVQSLIALLMDPSKKALSCINTPIVSNTPTRWLDIEDSLALCLNSLSSYYGSSNISNRQYLRLIGSILQYQQFHRSGMLSNLLSGMLNGLQRYPCPETVAACRLNNDLWIQLLSRSQASIQPLVIIAQSDSSSNGDWQMDIAEPSAKRPKMEFLPSSSPSLWEELKNRWLELLKSNTETRPANLERTTICVRVAIVGAKLKLKWREMNSVLDEADLQLLNTKLCSELLLVDDTNDSDEWMALIYEYLNSVIPLAYAGISKTVALDWMVFSALPWLSSVDASLACDLDPKWFQISRKSDSSLKKYRSDFSSCFVKFPVIFYRTWAVDIGLKILDMEFLQADAEALIPSLPWIARHGKNFREPLIQCLTNLLASGSSEHMTALTRNGANLVCALSGKMNAVTHPDEGLILRCVHGVEDPGAVMKVVNTVPEDTALFFLEFVFDENDHPVLYRMDLFRSILHHSAPTDNLRASIIKKLNKVTQSSQNQPALQRAMLKCTTILVQYWKEEIVADCFPVLFKLLLSDSYLSPMACWVKQTINEIATKLSLTPELLFQRQIPVIVDVLLSNSDPDWRINFISLVPDVFSIPNQLQWLGFLMPSLIPRLIAERSNGPSPVLDEICALLKTTQKDLVIKHFSSIYVYMLLHCDQQQQSALTVYVERLTRSVVPQLRAPNFQSVHNDLLIQLHSRRDRVLEALRIFSEDNNSSKAASNNNKMRSNRNLDTGLGDYLRSRFLGILVHLDGVLLSKTVSDQVKIEALASLSDILQLIGSKNITAVRLKVLATLRTALQLTKEPFPRLNATAWDTFVRILGVDELGPLVSQIAVSVLPLYSSCAEQIRSILYFMVVENADALKDHLKDLHFLPELPGLEDIVYALKTSFLANSGIPEQLALLMRNIAHEDFDVRMQSLTHLKSIVQNNTDTIQQLIMGTNDTSEDVVTRLISSLLRGCSVREEELLLLYGKCFGFLGAIDPGRLSFSDPHHGDSSVYTAVLINDDFTFHLLSLLARSFLAPRNSQTLTILSFTIQQILKIYNSEEDPTKLFKSNLWKLLPEQLQVAFTPLTSSRYILKQQLETGPAPFPVYRSSVGKSSTTWIYHWTAELITKVTHPLAKDIFKACLPTLKRDLNVNFYLLPYVVITALWSGGASESSRITEEIMAVLSDRGLLKSPRRLMKRFSSSASATDVSSQDSAAKDSADANLHEMSMQSVFTLLDRLKYWLKQKLNHHRTKLREAAIQRKERTISNVVDPEYKVVQELVDSIPNDLLARASYQCKAYARAILHLETYLKTHPDQLSDQLGFLQKLYVAMDEPDGVAGVCAIRDQEPSLEEKITAYEATGRLQDAFSCYERISQREDCSLEFYQGMLRCLLNLDLPQGALTMANGLLQNCPDWRHNLDDYRAECAWRLGQWDALEEVVQPYDSASSSQVVSWGVGLGQALLATKTGQMAKLENHLRSVRLGQMRVISAMNLERNSYPRAYENFVKLHILSEVESAVSLLDPAVMAKENVFRARFSELLNNWNQRLDGVQASVRYMEPVLNVRRVVLKLIEQQLEAKQPELALSVEEEIGKSWLVSARLARKADHFQRAHILQLVASTSPCPPPAIYMEQAQLHWAKGEQDQAITVLKRGLDKRFPDLVAIQTKASEMQPNELSGEVLECLKAKLLLARYCDQTGNADMSTIIKYYKEVTEISKVWEEGYFRLAGYYDHLWNNLGEGGKESHLDMARYIIANLSRSMFYGSHYIYQAMPRMLSLWMELGTVEVENAKAAKNTPGKVKFADITKGIESGQERIPAYKFLTAFPQLISRICHPHAEIAALLRRIISKVLVAHPQQCMWMMISVMKSSYNVRAKRCREIIDLANSTRPNLRTFFVDATSLAERLVELANKPVDDGVMILSVNHTFKALPRLLSQAQFSKIMVPLQWMMSVTLPTTPGEHINHNPFPRDPVYIVGVEDEVEVMQSLQRPKKISLRGSDGKLYVFLCKPQDDLRKDFRLMEFNQLINRYLMRDPDSRKRNLHIRTYGVIPLNEDCGLIEWIPNLIGLRPLLLRIYREKGLSMSNTDLRKKTPHLRDSIARKRELFLNEILPKFPSVFSEWFLTSFPDPQDWFSARLNYVRTLAVMSMVGYVVGLGDRHGENILFDSTCGDAVHVDFSCLFNKGQSFEWPEQVPFRLTHNMIEAMGSTGIEGSFRKCCEVTLRVLRKEIDTLLSVLKPFVHDPLVEWSKKANGNKGRTDQGEIKNEQALEHIGNIELRLQGYLQQLNSKNKVKVRLSVEGQASQLIAEAINVDNLCQMYVGWAAYM